MDDKPMQLPPAPKPTIATEVSGPPLYFTSYELENYGKACAREAFNKAVRIVHASRHPEGAMRALFIEAEKLSPPPTPPAGRSWP